MINSIIVARSPLTSQKKPRSRSLESITRVDSHFRLNNEIDHIRLVDLKSNFHTEVLAYFQLEIDKYGIDENQIFNMYLKTSEDVLLVLQIIKYKQKFIDYIERDITNEVIKCIAHINQAKHISWFVINYKKIYLEFEQVMNAKIIIDTRVLLKQLKLKFLPHIKEDIKRKYDIYINSLYEANSPDDDAIYFFSFEGGRHNVQEADLFDEIEILDNPIYIKANIMLSIVKEFLQCTYLIKEQEDLLPHQTKTSYFGIIDYFSRLESLYDTEFMPQVNNLLNIISNHSL
jgi:hypothetical protein